MPRALDLNEIPGIIEDFRLACLRAIDAGFDGVEVHGAHGYLLDAFLRDGTNHRTDAYGGPIANRSRLLVEVTKACATAIGADRLGVRISPVSTAGDSHDSQPQALFNHVVEALNPLGLAYVHVVEGETGGPGTVSRSIMPRCARGSTASGWSIMGMIARWRWRPWRAAGLIWCRLDGCSSRTRIWWRV